MTAIAQHRDLGFDYARPDDEPRVEAVHPSSRRVAAGYGFQLDGGLTQWAPLAQIPDSPNRIR